MVDLVTNSAWTPHVRSWSMDLAIATGLGLFLGLIGPFGSYFNGTFAQRAGFQILCFWLGTLIYGGGVRLLLRWQLPTSRLLLAIVLMTAVLTIPFSMIVSSIARAMWPFLASLPLFDWYLQGLVIALPVALGLTFVVKRRDRKAALRSEAKTVKAATDGLLGVFPSEVLCLQMEDHYVRVHTGSGSQLILVTMNQAIAALKPNQGLQVHRSWWVARGAVAEVETHGRNLRLRLVNGIVAPVARSAVATLRTAGWIETQGEQIRSTEAR